MRFVREAIFGSTSILGTRAIRLAIDLITDLKSADLCPDRPALVNNRLQALMMLESLERCFQRAPGLKDKYAAAIQKFIDQDDVDEVFGAGPPGKTCYLPHRAVLRFLFQLKTMKDHGRGNTPF